MPYRSNPFNALRGACALLLAALFATASQATPQALSDNEMSAVRGADGSIVAGLQATPGPSTSQNSFAAGLAAAFSSSTGSTLLTPAQFAASLASNGLTLAMMPDYNGEPVVQTIVDAKPVTFSFTLTDVLQATTGLQFNSNGASFGTFTMNNFDARGTTLWVWQHH